MFANSAALLAMITLSAVQLFAQLFITIITNTILFSDKSSNA